MISEKVIEKVLKQAESSARHSWEYGTVFEALLEYRNPSLCIFNDPFPDGRVPTLDEEEISALRYVKPFTLTEGDRLCEGNGEFTSSSFRKRQRETGIVRNSQESAKEGNQKWTSLHFEIQYASSSLSRFTTPVTFRLELFITHTIH